MSDFNQAMKRAKELAASPEGQQLAALLQQTEGIRMQQVMDSAAAGDFRPVQQAITALMQDPQARQILEALGGNNGK